MDRVAGYAEGGLIAFYAAAVDTAHRAALVSGYFNSRQDVWSEPIYRNVWSPVARVRRCGVASLIAPRGLIVEYSRVTRNPEPARKPEDTAIRGGPRRVLRPQPPAWSPMFQPRQSGGWSGRRADGSGSPEAIGLSSLLRRIARLGRFLPAAPADARRFFSSDERQKRQVQGMENQCSPDPRTPRSRGSSSFCTR